MLTASSDTIGAMGKRILTEVDGLSVSLTNLDEPLFADGFTKDELISYLVEAADAMLPHLADRPITRVRFPSGTGQDSFYEKNCPAGAPSWVQRIRVVSAEGSVAYVQVSRRADLVWLANLKAIELHAQQWRIADATSGSDGVILEGPDEPASTTVMVDLDPGPGVTLATTAQAAIVAATALAELGLECFPKTSGHKGLQLSAPHRRDARQHRLPLRPSPSAPLVTDAPRALHRQDRQAGPRWPRVRRYAQNIPARNTICAYSVRGLHAPSVSTPLTWDEVGSLWKGGCMTTTPAAVLDRLQAMGNLWSAQRPTPSSPHYPSLRADQR